MRSSSLLLNPIFQVRRRGVYQVFSLEEWLLGEGRFIIAMLHCSALGSGFALSLVRGAFFSK